METQLKELQRHLLPHWVYQSIFAGAPNLLNSMGCFHTTQPKIDSNGRRLGAITLFVTVSAKRFLIWKDEYSFARTNTNFTLAGVYYAILFDGLILLSESVLYPIKFRYSIIARIFSV